ncbi:MAG: GNAT family N-acetyltransferase [Firmicutes bacterium]|nr:GNAT family N-acetyltransferase [Bacillota bacterium]
MNYRKATIKDKEVLAHMMTLLHDELPLQEALDEYEYFLKNGVFFVACDGNEIVGYVHGVIRTDYVEGSEQYQNPKVGYIESLFVLSEYRKQGISRKLCKMLEDWSIEQGAVEFASDAYADNTDSIEFHKAIGFEVSRPIVGFIKKLKK